MAAPRFLCWEEHVGLFTTCPASGGGMGSEERNEVSVGAEGEVKPGVAVGPETEPKLVGLRLLEKAVFDKVNTGAPELASTIVDNAAKGNAGCAKMVTELCQAYERRLVGIGIVVSLGEILVRALEDEEKDRDQGPGARE